MYIALYGYTYVCMLRYICMYICICMHDVFMYVCWYLSMSVRLLTFALLCMYV